MNEVISSLYSLCSYRLPRGYALPPLKVFFEVTHRCNLKCEMCCYNRKAEKFITNCSTRKELSFLEVKHVVDEIDRFHIFPGIKPYVVITGGEPFVRKDMIQIMAYMKQKNLKFSVVTNGCLIDKKVARKIAEVNPHSIAFSLDGPKAIHDKIRGVKGTFESAIEALRTIRELRSAKDLRITINCVVCSINVHHLEEMVDIAKNLNVNLNYQHLMFLNNKRVEEHRKLMPKYFGQDFVNDVGGLVNDLQNFDARYLVRQIEKIYAETKRLNVNLDFLPRLTIEEIPQYYLDLDNYIHSDRCIYPWANVRINPYGEVHPCLEYQIGNLKNESLAKIYNNEKMRYFRRILKKEKLFPACARCCKI